MTKQAAGLDVSARQGIPQWNAVRASAWVTSDNGHVAHDPVDIAEKLSLFSEYWSPKTVARLNDYEIKVVKVQGEFTWHFHHDTDELFLVTKGQLTIQLRDGNVTLGPGQLFVVPRGVEHCPITDGEVHAMLIEPIGVVNTGDAGGSLTADHDDSLL
jgi:mannose-6-phosphate isomerase-like protein (cupin superfamily)